MSDRPDARLARHLQRTHGSFARATAIDLGFTRSMIDHRLSIGLWVPRHRGVYAHRAIVPTPLQRYEAATLAVHGSVLSGRAAAHLHGLDRCAAVPPEVTAPPSGMSRVPGITIRRRAGVGGIFVDRIRVATVAQTLADIVPRLPAQRLERIFDDAMLRSLATPSQLRDQVTRSRCGRAAGCRLFAELVHERLDAVGIAESVLELVLGRVAADVVGPHEVVRQASFPWWRSGAGRFDLAIPTYRLLLEADGRSWHARVAAFDEDRWRDAAAAANGHLVLRFSHTMLKYRAAEVGTLVRDTIRHRRAA